MNNQEDKSIKKINIFFICWGWFVWMAKLKRSPTWRGIAFLHNSENVLPSNPSIVSLDPWISQAESAGAKCSSRLMPWDRLQNYLQNPANISPAHEAPYGSPWQHIQLAWVWRKHYLTPSWKWFKGYSRIKWQLLKKTQHYIWMGMYIHFCCSFPGWLIDYLSTC